MKLIALLSGGLDSAVATAMALKEHKYDSTIALSFAYGQRHSKEIDCAQKLAAHFGMQHKILKADIIGESALTREDAEIIEKGPHGLPTSFVPGRNLVFIAMAASLAHPGRTCIVGGWNVVDYSGYPDCRPEFLRAAEDAVNLALGSSFFVVIKAPVLYLNKVSIVRWGAKLRVPFELTWSCYQGGEKPCNTCPSCKFRNEAFKQAGVEDPLWTL